MPKYKCLNTLCDDYNEINEMYGTQIKEINGQWVDVNARCPLCLETRETVKTDGYTTSFHGSPNIPIW